MTRQLGGDFEPLTLAFDDDGLRLIVRSAGRLAYWHVLPSGERIVSAALPPDLARPELAPIAADTGDVHLVAGDRVVTIGPDGRTRWEASLGAPIAGATALAGGALLVAAGPDVSTLDARGDRRLVHHLADARLATAVLPEPGGDLLVASERRLLCLSPP